MFNYQRVEDWFCEYGSIEMFSRTGAVSVFDDDDDDDDEYDAYHHDGT